MKEPKTLRDMTMIYNSYHISGEPKACAVANLCQMVRDWIKYIELPEKTFVRKFKKEEEQWNKEYDQGKHRNYSHNLASEWLAGVPFRFAEERAQVKILKKMFNIEDE